jgi:hypothetical protein
MSRRGDLTLTRCAGKRGIHQQQCSYWDVGWHCQYNPATASSRLSKRTSDAVGRVGVTVTRYVGPRGTTLAFRFWCHGKLSEVRGFSTRSLAIEAGRRERRRAEKAGFEGTLGSAASAVDTLEGGS